MLAAFHVAMLNTDRPMCTRLKDPSFVLFHNLPSFLFSAFIFSGNFVERPRILVLMMAFISVQYGLHSNAILCTPGVGRRERELEEFFGRSMVRSLLWKFSTLS